MRLRLTRRAVLLLLPLASGCGDDVPAPSRRRDFPPLRYGYLPPIKLNVQRLETEPGVTLPTGRDEIIGSSPIDPVETLMAMAHDRLQPVAQNGTATFRVLNASIVRHRDTLDGVLAVRLDVRDAEDTRSGYAEARVTATHTEPIADQRAAVYDILKSMMFDMNVELEYQLRNKLKDWVVEPEAAPATAPAPVPEPVDPSVKLPLPPPPPP